MKVICPHCKNDWSVSRKYSGVTVKCPRCQEPVGVGRGLSIVGFLLTVLISAALAVAVTYVIISRQTTPAKIETAGAELQAKIDEAEEKLEEVNTEIARLQAELARLTSEPRVAMAQDFTVTERLERARDLPAYQPKVEPESTEQSQPEQGQAETAELQGSQDSVDSLLVLEGTITRRIEPQILLVSSKGKTNVLTYSNYKYVPPFVLDELAVVELPENHPVLKSPDGAKLELYVVQEGTYDFQDSVGAIAIARTVNKYRETNLKNPPKQQLVEFRGESKSRGARTRRSQRVRF